MKPNYVPDIMRNVRTTYSISASSTRMHAATGLNYVLHRDDSETSDGPSECSRTYLICQLNPVITKSSPTNELAPKLCPRGVVTGSIVMTFRDCTSRERSGEERRTRGWAPRGVRVKFVLMTIVFRRVGD